jgi:LuxR family maltose regulon positive regulatory protein
LIARPRIDELLQEALDANALTVLHAPLGAGKSVALSCALAGRGDAVTLDAQPWHHGAFADAIVQCVRTVREDFGRRTLAALEAASAADTLGALFIADLQVAAAPLVLAIDNVEHLADDEAFALFLDTIVPALPSRVHVVVSGRAMPRFSLNEAIVRRRATLFDAGVLAFSEEEVRALAHAAGHDPQNERVEAIAHQSDGWATGVALALASPSLAQAAADSQPAAAFLREALLPHLPAEARAFLEDTAVYETLDRRVLRHDPAAASFERAIAALERSGAPLSHAGHGVYRLHALLRLLGVEGLRERGALGPRHARAAAAFAAAGELSAALFHARESGDERAAETLLREHGDALVRIANSSLLARTLELLRSPQTEDVRWYLEALLAKAAGDERAPGLFDRALRAADRDDHAGIAFAARAQSVERAIGRLQPVDERELSDLEIRAAGLPLEAQAQAAMYRGWQRAVAHDFAGALETIAPLANVDDLAARFNVGILFAYAQIASGEIDRGLSEIDTLVRLFEDDDRIVSQTLTLVWQSRLALVAGRTTLAGDAARAALRLVESLNIRAEEAALFASIAEVACHEGDVDAAVRYAERARRAAGHAWYAADVERTRFIADLTLARAAFLGHDNAIARDLAQRAERTASTPVQRAVAQAEGAAYAYIAGNAPVPQLLEDAVATLAGAAPVDAADAVMLANAVDIVGFLSAADGTNAVALPAPAPAFARLIEARRGLVTLEHAGIALAHLRSGSGTQVAFDLALERLVANGPRFEARLARVVAAPFVRERDAPVSVPAFDLTPRELEILTLLVEGLSNKEIAQRLILSPRTAETHVERVLSKLDVPSRSRAIAKSLRLGLVVLSA